MSFKTFLGERPVVDPHRMRAQFPQAWARMLRARFATPLQIAAAFGVTEQTAYNWLDGRGRPTGDKVAMLFGDPDAAAVLMAEIRRAA